MKCPKCGKEIANDSVFCEFCGTKVKHTSQWVGKNDIIIYCLLILIALSAMYNLIPLFHHAGWYLGGNRISIIDRALTEIFLPMLSTSLGCIFLYNAWKYKDVFLKNSQTAKNWLLWCVVCAVLNVLAGCVHYMRIMLAREGVYFEYVIYDLIFLEIGNMIMAVCYAGLLLRVFKQSKIDCPVEVKLTRPLYILVVVAILSMLIVVM
jgi:predicted nucleic acid-binding Zn ribbon protein